MAAEWPLDSDDASASGVTCPRCGFHAVPLPSAAGERSCWPRRAVAIAGIGLLAFGAAVYAWEILPARRAADRAVASADVRSIVDALDEYAIAHGGTYPPSLAAIVTLDAEGRTLFRGRTTIPLDPWGRAYRYTPPHDGEPYHVFTLGRDGLTGGRGADEDVDSLLLLPAESGDTCHLPMPPNAR